MAFPTSLKVRTNLTAFSCQGNTQPFCSPATFGMVLTACNVMRCENSIFHPARRSFVFVFVEDLQLSASTSQNGLANQTPAKPSLLFSLPRGAMSKDLKLHRNLLWVFSAAQLSTDVKARNSRKPGFHLGLPLKAFNGPAIALLFSMAKFSPTTKYSNAYANFALPHVLFLLTVL